MKSHKTFQKTKKAFTVIELLVIIVIIGVLATIIAVNYGGWKEKANNASVVSDANSINAAEKLYVLSTNNSGKTWFSGNGTDSNLKVSLSSGNVADVVTDSEGYCIRVYNPNTSLYKNIYNSYQLESVTGKCSTIAASGSGTFSSSPTATVSTFAGSTLGSANGTGTSAQFNNPTGIVLEQSTGNLYVADYGNNLIRKVTPAGVVTTFAGSGVGGSTDATGTAATFSGPGGLAIDSAGNLYVADFFNSKIRKITSAGVVTTLAGSGVGGFADGTGTAAKFYDPWGVAVDSAGNVYVADTYNYRIRKISSSGVVSTLAGSGVMGYADGVGTAAQFNYPAGVAVDSSGNVYVADQDNNRIRLISPAGVVTTLAGSGVKASADGVGLNAQFASPHSVSLDGYGNLYVGDEYSHKVRKITPDGTVGTLAGTTDGYLDGLSTSAQFSHPLGVTAASFKSVYVVERNNNRIRLITW
jgi:type II secretory pathway pseudopilin PulG